MKAKLLKRLRREGRNQISILSITKTNGEYTAMKYSYDDSAYSSLFSYGDDEETVLKKAERIYLENNIHSIKSYEIQNNSTP